MRGAVIYNTVGIVMNNHCLSRRQIRPCRSLKLFFIEHFQYTLYLFVSRNGI